MGEKCRALVETAGFFGGLSWHPRWETWARFHREATYKSHNTNISYRRSSDNNKIPWSRKQESYWRSGWKSS